jgi:hypothetical protein
MTGSALPPPRSRSVASSTKTAMTGSALLEERHPSTQCRYWQHKEEEGKVRNDKDYTTALKCGHNACRTARNLNTHKTKPNITSHIHWWGQTMPAKSNRFFVRVQPNSVGDSGPTPTTSNQSWTKRISSRLGFRGIFVIHGGEWFSTFWMHGQISAAILGFMYCLKRNPESSPQGGGGVWPIGLGQYESSGSESGPVRAHNPVPYLFKRFAMALRLGRGK